MMKIIMVTCLAALTTTVLSAEEIVAPQLHIDPFINPLQTVQDQSKSNTGDRESELDDAEVIGPRESFLWQPELRGIIRSEDIAIANMGGEMIELGMKYDGYRLIEVKGQSVVFEKNGRQYPVSLDGTDEDESAL